MDFVFGAPYPMHYPENKDAQGVNLSEVQPGDIRDLDGPPDHWWREATDEDRARPAAAVLAEDRERGAEERAEQHEDAGGQETGEPSEQHEPGE